ncbi:hypothetical protein BX666DRAFT_1958824 [Dichotomocladium elegans]|nr:hypothetical protein BX666DRAFT_1958824 [Dichotomocladium elegans]
MCVCVCVAGSSIIPTLSLGPSGTCSTQHCCLLHTQREDLSVLRPACVKLQTQTRDSLDIPNRVIIDLVSHQNY